MLSCHCMPHHNRKAHETPRRKRRAGFTLVELMIAILIMTIGLLALVSGAALVTRYIGATARESTAVQVAQSRLEWLRASPCRSLRDSTTMTRGVGEFWIARNVGRAVVIVDSVRYTTLSGRTRSQGYWTMVPCV